MATIGGSEITRLLKAWGAGDQTALERLTPLVYDRLRRLASQYLRRESAGQTLQRTALVHEVYVRLIEGCDIDWQDRGHFFAIAAQAMRRILDDAARARRAEKRGGQMERAIHAGKGVIQCAQRERTIRAGCRDRVEITLRCSLARLDPRRAQVIELRFFGGLTVDETAEALQISDQTVMRDWKTARTWLVREPRRA